MCFCCYIHIFVNNIQYTEPLGDNLEAIKQQLLYEDDDTDDIRDEYQDSGHNQTRSSFSSFLHSEDTSINIRNAEPWYVCI